MTYRRTNLCALLCLATWLSFRSSVMAAPEAAKSDTRPVLGISKDTVLDPKKTHGPIVIKASDISIDGRGAWVIGAIRGDPKDYKDVGVSGNGVSHVRLRNLNVKGWDIGLKVEHGSHWLVGELQLFRQLPLSRCGLGRTRPSWRHGLGVCRSFHAPPEQGQPRLGCLHAGQLGRQFTGGERLFPYVEHLPEPLDHAAMMGESPPASG